MNGSAYGFMPQYLATFLAVKPNATYIYNFFQSCEKA